MDSLSTTQQVMTGVRVLLRRPSDLKLPDDDIREKIMDLLKGYQRDLKLAHLDRASVKAEVQLVPGPDVDYTIEVPNEPDFEAEKLEYELYSAGYVERYEARLWPHSTWGRHYSDYGIAASIYGGNKIAINLSPASALNRRWFLTYRPSLLTVLQKDSPIPLPSDFIPMLKNEAAILCMPLVRDDSPEWIAWMDRTLPIYLGTKREWNNPDDPMRPGRWQHHLASSAGPEIFPIERSDRHRRRSGRVRPYVPLA